MCQQGEAVDSPLLVEGWYSVTSSLPYFQQPPSQSPCLQPLPALTHHQCLISPLLILSDCFRQVASMLRSLGESLCGINTVLNSVLTSQFCKINLLVQQSLSFCCSSDMTSSFPSLLWSRVLWVANGRNPAQICSGRKGKFLDSQI